MLNLLNGTQWIIGRLAVNDFTGLFNHNLIAIDLDHGCTGQSDHRVATPLLAALYGLKQVAVCAPCEFDIRTNRRLEIGQHRPHHGDTVVTCSPILVIV